MIAKHYETLVKLEESLWREKSRGNRELMEATFDDDCYEFGRSGTVWSRSELLDQPKQPIDVTLPLPDLKATMLDEKTALVTYTSIAWRNDAASHTRRSSVWSLTASGWRLRFHQGTPFEP